MDHEKGDSPRAPQSHNFGALILWVILFRRSARLPRVALGLFAASLALILSGATVGWTARIGDLSTLGVDVNAVATWLTAESLLRIAVPRALVHAFAVRGGRIREEIVGTRSDPPTRGCT